MSEYNRLLWVIAGGILGGERPEDVEECVADVWIALWRRPRAFDPKKGSLKTYLSVMTRSRAIDALRSGARKARFQAPPTDEAETQSEDASEEMLKRELFGELHDAVNALGEPERELVVRRYFFGQKPAEISERLGMPVKDVNNRLYAAKKRLKKQLEGTM
jgi:RNA polymerase sigma-70 factor (ECF subfamily)